MNRRQLCLSAGVVGLVGLAGGPAAAQGFRAISAAAEAWLYALPLIEMATTRRGCSGRLWRGDQQADPHTGAGRPRLAGGDHAQ